MEISKKTAVIAILFALILTLVLVAFHRAYSKKQALKSDIEMNILSKRMALSILDNQIDCRHETGGQSLPDGPILTREERERCQAHKDSMMQPLRDKYEALLTPSGCAEQLGQDYQGSFTHEQLVNACGKAINRRIRRDK